MSSTRSRPSVLCIAQNQNFLGFTRQLRLAKFDFLPHELIEGPSTHMLLKRGLWRISFERKLRKYCSKYDLLFCDWAAQWTADATRLIDDVPIVVRLHLYEIDRPDLLDAINWQNVSMLVVVSDYMKTLASQSPHIKARRCMTIPNGVDLERFTFNPSNSGQLCTYSFFDQPQKRVYDLMLALRDETLHIGGKGTMSRVMASTINRFGLRHVLHGYVELPKWLRDKEYFFMHSSDESSGVALLEAMASGLVCMSHDYEASKEILPTRYRYRYDDELLRLLAELRALGEEERLRVKVEQRKIVETKHDARDQAAQFDLLFENCAEEKK
jgi:glycosyltransferase involved in cell wall biosynthesis